MKRFLIVLMALVSALAVTGCSAGSGHYEAGHYTAPAGAVTAVCIDVRDRKVEIGPSADGQIHIDYYESDREGYAIDLSEDKRLSIVPAEHKTWTDYVGGKAPETYRTIRLLLPECGLEALCIRTSNADLSLPALEIAHSVELSVNNGSIALAALNAGNSIALEAKNGNITGAIAGSYDDFSMTSGAHKGENNLPARKETGEKTLSVHTNNGDIRLEFTK